MEALRDPLLILIMAINFYTLGASRIRSIINAVAFQGFWLGLLIPVYHPSLDLRGIGLVLVTIALKCFVIPYFLLRAMREADIQHEVKPVVGFVGSLLLGAAGTALAMRFAYTLPLAEGDSESLIVPASLSTALTGFLLLTTRKTAILQVLGYLVLENGIFIFGLLLLEAMPFLVEIGVLLDVFTGVFVMGIIVYQINREFSSISTERFSELRE
jgi:hydrogenase-4 component E